MDKIVFTGPTQYLGAYHFTRGKIYDVHPYSIIDLIVSDNDMNYYLSYDYSTHFITLDKWRELQINRVLDL